ncbi:hypothetical protein [Dictyobacter formicarum]|uniref:Uncharacterized protein n=1 Tax=Dictyobacter formicarum TaxID=2778368 RepID=A0ABQ3VMK8_9CHLR|nr:hypothetical protein [Dictyobacter formicarum]GHO87030.1 hypothetical protein KSZ_50360 [Dictyobacter formicarum]
MEPAALALLDVSSNADQLGVVLLAQESIDSTGVTIDNLVLAARQRSLAIFTMPVVSWEPMASVPLTHSAGNLPVPLPPGDGGATLLQVPTVHLSPIKPLPLLKQYISNVNTEGASILADFSLPFGLRAHVQVVNLKKQRGKFQLNQPIFSNACVGGLQLTMTPPWPWRENASFPGYTLVIPPYLHRLQPISVDNLPSPLATGWLI